LSDHDAIKAMIELRAKPGARQALVSVMDAIAASMRTMPGFLGIKRYGSIDDPELIIEIAEWASAAARAAWLTSTAGAGVLQPLMRLLAEPPRSRNLIRLETPDMGRAGEGRRITARGTTAPEHADLPEAEAEDSFLDGDDATSPGSSVLPSALADVGAARSTGARD
jgi:quinol monooxygenase YgiN